MLTVVEESINPAANTSIISWNFQLIPVSKGWDWNYSSTVPVTYTIDIAGNKYDGSIMKYDGEQVVQVAGSTFSIKHDNDGTKTIAISFSVASISANYLPGSASGTWQMDLTVTAPASQPSCITYPNHTQNVGSFGDTISIHMNRKSSEYTHTVRYAFGNLSGTCIDADTGKAATGLTAVTNGFRWTIPESFMELLPTATSGSGTIYVDTYNRSTLIGTKYCGFTATVPESVKPSASIQVLDNTGIKDIYGNLVKGLSKLYVKTTGTQAYKSPIKSYNVTANDVRYTAAEIVTGVLTKAGTTTVTATVTDERGRTSAAASASFSVLDYTAPTVTKLSVMRCNEDGTANKRGGYCKVTFSATITPLNDKNTAIYYLRYKKTTATDYTQVTMSAQTGKYAVTNYSYIFAAATGSSFDVEVKAVDRHATGARSAKCPTASSVFSWRGFRTSSGVEDGAGIGRVPDRANALQVGWETEFDEVVTFRKNTYVFSSIGAATTEGYIRMARITVTETNADTPMTFVFFRRQATAPMTVHALFKSTADTKPGMSSFTYEGENYGAYLTQISDGVWDLFVQKANQSDTVTLQSWHTSARQMKRVEVTFPDGIESTVPQGLVGYYRATPAVLRSMLDCLKPVGYVEILYSHADPNTMYPGTTWVRIQNAFLWAVDGSGQIGLTGGAKEVTLTVDQIPAHTHGSVYSQHATGTKDKAWYTTAGTSVAYGAVSTGGGEAHNNMPPYIQVSVWRRTA